MGGSGTGDGRRTSWRVRLLAALLGLFAAIACGEIAARLLLDDTEVFSRIDRWEPHPRLGRVLKPNQVYEAAGAEHRINADRLRGPALPPRVPEGAYRVAVVGDSFVFGVGPEETIFPHVLEARLRARYGERVEVLSVGLPGFGTVQQNDFLEDLLPEHGFDLLVHAFCVGNDVRENRRSIAWEQDPAKLADHFRAPGPWRRLTSASRLLGAVRNAVGRGRGDPEERFDEYVERRIELALPDTYEEPSWAAAWERTLAELERMREIATSRGADFGVVLLPDEYQVDAGLRDRIARRAGLAPEDLVPDLLQSRLGAALRQRGVEVLDPLPRFRQEHRPGTLFLPLDTHYDAAGNRLVAIALERWIADRHGDAIERRLEGE